MFCFTMLFHTFYYFILLCYFIICGIFIFYFFLMFSACYATSLVLHLEAYILPFHILNLSSVTKQVLNQYGLQTNNESDLSIYYAVHCRQRKNILQLTEMEASAKRNQRLGSKYIFQ